MRAWSIRASQTATAHRSRSSETQLRGRRARPEKRTRIAKRFPDDARTDSARPRRRPAAPPRPADRAGADRARRRVDARRATAARRRAAGLGLHLARGAPRLARRGSAAALGAHGERRGRPSDVPRTRRVRHGGDQRARRLRPADRRVRGRAGPRHGQGSAAAPWDLQRQRRVAAPRVAAGRGHPRLRGRFAGRSGGRSSGRSRRSVSRRPSSGAPRAPVSTAPRSWTG